MENVMNANTDLRESGDGQGTVETQAMERPPAESAQSGSEHHSSTSAIVAGVLTFAAAAIFGLPEAFLGAAAGVSVYAIDKHNGKKREAERLGLLP
jgi:hypothetical protein